MIAHRRTWYYRLAGQSFAQPISFKVPISARKAKALLGQLLGVVPVEVWGR